MKWTKASEKMPVVENRAAINIKYKGRAALIVFYHGGWFWSDNSYSETHLHPVEKDSWSAIEYLDETEQASPDGWVSVKDALPDYDKHGAYQLIFGSHPDFRGQDIHYAYLGDDKKTWFYRDLEFHSVTHWQPLPPLPKND